MGLIAVPADEYCISYVLTHLRPHCLREICGTRAEGSEHALQQVYDMIERARWAQMVRVALFATEGPPEPIAIAIAYRVGAVMAEFQSFSTSKWDLISLPFVRWFKREVVPVLVQNGMRVAEAQILLDGPAHFRWWAMMGMFRSGSPLPYGVNGELYQRMVWIREDLRNVQDRTGVQPNIHTAGNGRSRGGRDTAAGRHPEAAGTTGGGNAKFVGGGGTSAAATNGSHQGIAQGRAPGVR